VRITVGTYEALGLRGYHDPVFKTLEAPANPDHRSIFGVVKARDLNAYGAILDALSVWCGLGRPDRPEFLRLGLCLTSRAKSTESYTYARLKTYPIFTTPRTIGTTFPLRPAERLPVAFGLSGRDDLAMTCPHVQG
jgi:hypothetical protein